jgi:hypothetical protein
VLEGLVEGFVLLGTGAEFGEAWGGASGHGDRIVALWRKAICRARCARKAPSAERNRR